MTLWSLLLLIPLSLFSIDPREDLFLSMPEEISALVADPEYLIGGIVSPISGHPVLRKIDLVAKGAEDVVLQRTYIPFQLPCHAPDCVDDPDGVCTKIEQQHIIARSYRGWQVHQHLYIHRVQTKKRSYFSIPDPSGVLLPFSVESRGELRLIAPDDCLTNVQGEKPSGKYDLRNTRVFRVDHDHIKVDAPDATTRFYTKRGEIFRLEKEILPNGKVLQYHYNVKEELKSIRSMDPKERYIYAQIDIDSKYRARTSTGLSADYFYDKRQAVQEGLALPPLLTGVSTPFYRHETIGYCDGFLLGLYQSDKERFNPKYTGFGNPAHYRVSSLSFPVGPGDELTPLYHMEYQPAEGKTTVRYSDGRITRYFFSSQFLLTRIEYLGPGEHLQKEKRFFWDKKNRLEALELRGEQGLLYRISYEYDRFGNPVVESLLGDLTGEGVETTACTRRTFSDDGRNLLLREETEDKKVLYFFYLPGTNLVVRKYTNDWDRIVLREFREYDDAKNLLCVIQDDGCHEKKEDLTGVTQRRITRYILRQSAPFLHMPEWVEESYIDPGNPQGILTKKTHLHYDARGNVEKEEVFGGKGTLLYTTYTTYNERGDVLSKTDKSGRQAEYRYNDQGNLCSFTPPSHRRHTLYHRDTKGRLVQKEELGDDGLLRTFHTTYDLYDRVLQEQDFLGNKITYIYDPLTSQPIRTEYPSTLSLCGQSVPVITQATYDAFGRKSTETDALGNTTLYRYNAYGSPTHITYPDGSTERFYYTKQGVLKTHINQENLRIDLNSDILARVTKRTYTSSDGKILAQEKFTYSGFSLVSEQDKEGHITHYIHDGMGRTGQKKEGSKIIDFHYDEGGYLSCICKHDQENTLHIYYQRDVEGHMTEKLQTDVSGRILRRNAYTYDSDGNRISIIQYVQGVRTEEFFSYDSRHRCIRHQDALGLITTTSYEEGIMSSSGQKLLYKRIKAPSGIDCFVEDGDGNLIQHEKRSLQGALLALQERFYDPANNLICLQDQVYGNPNIQQERVLFAYNAMQQKVREARAYGTSHEQVTRYTYTPSGLLRTKTLPSGVSLQYTYNPFGWQERIDSSDGSIHHRFSYNLLGDLLLAVDENQELHVIREIDPYGNVQKESFSTGLSIEQEYDVYDRPTTLRIPGQGAVHYTYDPLYLRKVTRVSNTRKPLYTHSISYDESGVVSQEKLIGNLGSVVHTVDLTLRPSRIKSPYFSAEYHYNLEGNLAYSFHDTQEEYYAYDDLNQLVQERNRTYAYDSLYNKVRKNETFYEVNSLNEPLLHEVDLDGRMTSCRGFSLVYDPLDRLIQAHSASLTIAFEYDPLGRCIRKTRYPKEGSASQELYLYVGDQEIGTFTQDLSPIHLKILGAKNAPIAIESQGKTFAPLIDAHHNIRRLIDLDTHQKVAHYDFTAFGEELVNTSSVDNPWRFASKRLDPDLNLIAFAKRYYNPELALWMSKDPAGFLDSVNPYQYVFNNPFRYADPQGEFIFALPLLFMGSGIFLPSLTTIVTPIVYGALISAIAYTGYKVVEQYTKDDGDCPTVLYQEQTSEKKPKEKFQKEPVRTEPDDLIEQLTLEEAKANKGKDLNKEIDIKDSRYPKEDWGKRQVTHGRTDGSEKVNIHYWENLHTGERHGFKFKNPPPHNPKR